MRKSHSCDLHIENKAEVQDNCDRVSGQDNLNQLVKSAELVSLYQVNFGINQSLVNGHLSSPYIQLEQKNTA